MPVDIIISDSRDYNNNSITDDVFNTSHIFICINMLYIYILIQYNLETLVIILSDVQNNSISILKIYPVF